MIIFFPSFPLAPILIFILQHNPTPSTSSSSGVNISWYLSLLFRSKGGSHRAGNLHWTGVFSTPTGHKIQIKLLWPHCPPYTAGFPEGNTVVWDPFFPFIYFFPPPFVWLLLRAWGTYIFLGKLSPESGTEWTTIFILNGVYPFW